MQGYDWRQLRMKRLRLLVTILFMLSLTGCIQEYKLTDQQSDATAEYMAGLLLKYDKEYEPHLTPREQLTTKENANSEVSDANTATPTPVQEEAITENVDNEGEANKDYTLSEVIGEDDIEMQYSGYEICETYPEDTTNAYFSLDPVEGKQFLVTSFLAKNLSDKEKTLTLRDSQVQYQLDINVGTIHKPILTLLVNDLHNIDIVIGAGKTETVLLVFEVSKDIDITDINLIASKDDRIEIIEIK